MPQMHFYISDAVAQEIRRRAKSAGKSTSSYLAEMVKRELGEGWPEDFAERTLGQWAGEPLTRAPQGEFERRESLD